tara:strand:+ start:700 stop:993 length:294 start_codon:yes stop_codon:yes gene_type:complete
MSEFDEFEIFCLYHLGLQGAQAGTPLNLNQLAGRLGASPEAIQTFIEHRKLDAGQMLASGFDLVGAQLDIQHAPEGIDLQSAAFEHFKQYKTLLSED